METVFNYVDKDKGFFSSDERKWVTKIHKLHEKYPDEVLILAEPEDNGGCIYCQLPSSWLNIRPKRVLSEEEKAKYSVRAKKVFWNR